MTRINPGRRDRLTEGITVRLFVYEFVCGGGWSDRPVDGSLLAEGRAMQRAAVEDFARIPGCSVVTTSDGRWNRSAPDDVAVVPIADPVQERSLFRQLAAQCDATFVIAPECHGILSERRRWVTEVDGTFLGPSQSAIDLCTDKRQLAGHLNAQAIPTIPAEPVDQPFSGDGLAFPMVIKPRDGAGSQQTFLVRTQGELERAVRSLAESDEPFEAIAQPYVAGRSLSLAVLISGDNSHHVFCPPAEQRLSDDGRFRYLGGRAPVAVESAHEIPSLIERCLRAIPGLRGYVGFDLIQPSGPSSRNPLIVEINPRLTTSYLGYRELTPDNLAERILFPDRTFPELSWQNEPVEWQIQNAKGGVDMTDCF